MPRISMKEQISIQSVAIAWALPPGALTNYTAQQLDLLILKLRDAGQHALALKVAQVCPKHAEK